MLCDDTFIIRTISQTVSTIERRPIYGDVFLAYQRCADFQAFCFPHAFEMLHTEMILTNASKQDIIQYKSAIVTSLIV